MKGDAPIMDFRLTQGRGNVEGLPLGIIRAQSRETAIVRAARALVSGARGLVGAGSSGGPAAAQDSSPGGRDAGSPGMDSRHPARLLLAGSTGSTPQRNKKPRGKPGPKRFAGFR